MNMIHFGYPVVVLILMTLIYKEKINLLKILSALSSIIGIFLLTKIAAFPEKHSKNRMEPNFHSSLKYSH